MGKFLDYMNHPDVSKIKLITEDSNFGDEIKRLIELGKEIARKLGVMFNGVWEDFKNLLVFTDPKTKSTFTARSEEEAIKKLENMRIKFKMA